MSSSPSLFSFSSNYANQTMDSGNMRVYVCVCVCMCVYVCACVCMCVCVLWKDLPLHHLETLDLIRELGLQLAEVTDVAQNLLRLMCVPFSLYRFLSLSLSLALSLYVCVVHVCHSTPTYTTQSTTISAVSGSSFSAAPSNATPTSPAASIAIFSGRMTEEDIFFC